MHIINWIMNVHKPKHKIATVAPVFSDSSYHAMKQANTCDIRTEKSNSLNISITACVERKSEHKYKKKIAFKFTFLYRFKLPWLCSPVKNCHPAFVAIGFVVRKELENVFNIYENRYLKRLESSGKEMQKEMQKEMKGIYDSKNGIFSSTSKKNTH